MNLEYRTAGQTLFDLGRFGQLYYDLCIRVDNGLIGDWILKRGLFMKSRFLFLAMVLSFPSVSLFGQTEITSNQESEIVQELKEFRSKNESNYRTVFLVRQIIGISHRTELLRELEIVENQKQDLDGIGKRYAKRFQAIALELAPRPNENGELPSLAESSKISIEMEKRNFVLANETLMEIEQVLLPHQISRIEEIAEMEKLNSLSNYSGKLGLPLAASRSIGLSKFQSDELRRVTDESDAQFKKDVEQLHKKYFDKIVATLPKEGQKKQEQKIGKGFMGEVFDDRLR